MPPIAHNDPSTIVSDKSLSNFSFFSTSIPDLILSITIQCYENMKKNLCDVPSALNEALVSKNYVKWV